MALLLMFSRTQDNRPQLYWSTACLACRAFVLGLWLIMSQVLDMPLIVNHMHPSLTYCCAM